jgi:hypothetical protein
MLLGLVPATVGAQEANPKFQYGKLEKVKDVEWKALAKAGLVYSSGNSQVTNVTAGLSISRKSPWNKFALDAGAAYARSFVWVASDANLDGFIDPTDPAELRKDFQTTANNWFAKARYDRFFTTNNSLYIAALGAGDRPAGKEFFGGGQIGYSRQLVKDKYTDIQAELGYDVSYENYLDPPAGKPGSVTIHSARLFVGAHFKLQENTVLASSVEVLSNLNKENVANASTRSNHVPGLEDTRVYFKTGLTTKIYKNISLGVSFTLKYDNNPALLPAIKDAPQWLPGVEPFAKALDTVTEAVLVVNFL